MKTWRRIIAIRRHVKNMDLTTQRKSINCGNKTDHSRKINFVRLPLDQSKNISFDESSKAKLTTWTEKSSLWLTILYMSALIYCFESRYTSWSVCSFTWRSTSLRRMLFLCTYIFSFQMDQLSLLDDTIHIEFVLRSVPRYVMCDLRNCHLKNLLWRSVPTRPSQEQDLYPLSLLPRTATRFAAHFQSWLDISYPVDPKCVLATWGKNKSIDSLCNQRHLLDDPLRNARSWSGARAKFSP